jgi:hypothetical protein
MKSVDIIENELLDPGDIPEPFRAVLLDYFAALERYVRLTSAHQFLTNIPKSTTRTTELRRLHRH